MTQLFVVFGWWAHLDAPHHENDWDVWITDSEAEIPRIMEALGPGAGGRVQVRELVPSVFFDAQYALNPRHNGEMESHVGPRREEDELTREDVAELPEAIQESAREVIRETTRPPRRDPEDAPVWERKLDG